MPGNTGAERTSSALVKVPPALKEDLLEAAEWDGRKKRRATKPSWPSACRADPSLPARVSIRQIYCYAK